MSERADLGEGGPIDRSNRILVFAKYCNSAIVKKCSTVASVGCSFVLHRTKDSESNSDPSLTSHEAGRWVCWVPSQPNGRSGCDLCQVPLCWLEVACGTVSRQKIDSQISLQKKIATGDALA